jgi:hypothetical protein
LASPRSADNGLSEAANFDFCCDACGSFPRRSWASSQSRGSIFSIRSAPVALLGAAAKIDSSFIAAFLGPGQSRSAAPYRVKLQFSFP